MKQLIHKFLLCAAFLVSTASVFAQVYPVVVAPSPLAPASIYFDDFYAAMNPKLRVMVHFNDLTTPQRDIYLKVKITGPGINIASTPGQRPLTPITIFSGVPTDLIGSDLADVFDFNRLTFGGITRAQLEGNGRLPEGDYTLTFTAMDYQQNVPVSQEAPLTMRLALSDPPQIINPSCGGVVTQIDPPNFLFNWMITNSNSQIDLGNVNYQINLYEVTSNTTNPQNAIMNNQALLVWQSIPQNSFVHTYGITEPPLEVGKRYVFNVQAIENYPRTQIKNNGFSAPCWFYYGYPEGGHIQLTNPDSSYQFNLSDPGKFSWKRPSNALPGQQVSYDYKVVEVLEGQTPAMALDQNVPFNTYTVSATTDQQVHYVMPNAVLNDLKKMHVYAWTVKGKTNNQTVASSGIRTFVGPPYIDKFYAANFLVEITSLTSFDTVNYTISGTGKVRLKNTFERPEFSFQNVKLQSAGNNLWVMIDGYIEDNITISKYDIQPKTVSSNGVLSFQPDKIFIDKDNLRLGGKCSWNVPVVAASNTLPVIKSKYTHMMLANETFELAYENPIELETNYDIPLLEPYGFHLLMDYSSTIVVYQSKYEFSLEGFVELPESVQDVNSTTVLVPYRNQKQVNLMEEQGVSYVPEQIDFLSDSDFGLRGEHYFIDLSEVASPGDKSADSSWKGVYYQTARIHIPEHGEGTNQLSCYSPLDVLVINEQEDSTKMYIDETGLNFTTSLVFNSEDTLLFNTFPSTQTNLTINIIENFFDHGGLVGYIHIPLIDTAKLYPYTVPLTSYGFQLGNIDESLVNTEFVFNGLGAAEEQVNMKITRAVFKGNNRIEMDLDATWQYFGATLQNLQSMNAWGNGNIGFDIPNGSLPLNNQIIAHSGDYELVVDYVGCGRDRNAYAFGISAKINMAENISGESGAPVMNAYSMYLNPLLSGQFNGNGNDPGGILPGFGVNSDTSGFSPSTQSNANNLAGDLDYLGDSLGVNYNDTLTASGGSNALISEGTYVQMQKIIQLAEIFVEFIDSAKAVKARDYIAVAKQALNSDAVKGMVNKDPKEFLQDLLEEALESIIQRATQPITNATNKAKQKFVNLVHNNISGPVNGKINNGLDKAFDRIREQAVAVIDDPEVKALVEQIINDAKNSIKTQVTVSITTAVDENITYKITDFIEQAIVKQITDFIAGEIRYVGMELIMNGTNASIDFNHVLDNADTLFDRLGDTIVAGVKSVSLHNIIKTAESVADDALNGIDWDKVLDDILNSAIQNGVSTALNEALGSALGGMGMDNIFGNVSFDFTNLGEKISNGDIAGIIKFDPTNINIKTSACHIHGQLNHYDDDPVYGEHWKAVVEVKLLKPDKLKDVGIAAMFITGKTKFSAPIPPNYQAPVDTSDAQAVADYQAQLAADAADSSLYSFWFASLGVSGLSIPLSPVPLKLTGIEGFAYHHMQRATPASFPQPCRRNKLGLGIGFDFVDLPSGGKFAILDMQLEVIINEGAWAAEMYTLAKVGNKGGASSTLPPLAQAEGTIGYYSAAKRFFGQITITFNTSPLLCAGGEIIFDFNGSANTWVVSAGTPGDPMFAKLLCKDWLSITAFVEAKNSGFKSGIDLNIDITAKTPWLDLEIIRLRGTASAYVKFNAYVDLQFEPEFRLNEAYIYIAIGASIGVDYNVGFGDKHITLVGIALAGNVHYKAAPEGYVQGGVSGYITIVGIDIGIDVNVNYDLKNRNDNS